MTTTCDAIRKMNEESMRRAFTSYAGKKKDKKRDCSQSME